MNKTIDLTLDEWYEQFHPIARQFDEPPKDFDHHFVWTAVDGDEGQFCVSEGIHWVNRIFYYVTEVPWEDNIFYNVVDDEELFDEEEDDDE